MSGFSEGAGSRTSSIKEEVGSIESKALDPNRLLDRGVSLRLFTSRRLPGTVSLCVGMRRDAPGCVGMRRDASDVAGSSFNSQRNLNWFAWRSKELRDKCQVLAATCTSRRDVIVSAKHREGIEDKSRRCPVLDSAR